MFLSETDAQHNRHKLRINMRGRRIVIARFGIDAVRRLADPKGETAAGVSAEHTGSRTGESLAGGHESSSTVESPPEPGRCTSRRSAHDRDRL